MAGKSLSLRLPGHRRPTPPPPRPFCPVYAFTVQVESVTGSRIPAIMLKQVGNLPTESGPIAAAMAARESQPAMGGSSTTVTVVAPAPYVEAVGFNKSTDGRKCRLHSKCCGISVTAGDEFMVEKGSCTFSGM